MLPTVRRRSKSGKTAELEGFEQFVRMQQEEIEGVKARYSQQNSQLAKQNSMLMKTIRDMEVHRSQLIKENVELRSSSLLQEQQYKAKLEEQLNVIQDGVLQRFEEILYIFDRIRQKEELEPYHGNCKITNRRSSGSTKSILSGSKGPKRPSSIRFNEPEMESKMQEEDVARKKRRKSSRRESIYSPSELNSPSPQNDDEEEEDLGLPPRNLEVEDPLPDNNEMDLQDEENVTNDIQKDNSVNFNHSILECSIAEEVSQEQQSPQQRQIKSSSSASSDSASSSKIQVYLDEGQTPHDEQNTTASNKGLPSGYTTILHENVQNKIKHSMKPIRTKNRAKKMDEAMPPRNNSISDNISLQNIRRTRGKTVDYKLPSLRAKMRRPTAKLVDATTITNIQDLQVDTKRRRSKRSGSLQGDEKPPETTDIIASPDIAKPTDNTSHPNSELPTDTTNQSKLKKLALTDITNTGRPKSAKTKKLLKKAIISDLCDENSNILGEISTISPPSSSLVATESPNFTLRLNEDDLSVFDLIGGKKTNNATAKTYRSKIKKNGLKEKKLVTNI